MPSFARAVALGVAAALSALAAPAPADGAGAVALCRDRVAACDAAADYFPDKINVRYANKTITSLAYAGTHVDVDVYSPSLDEPFLYRFVRCGCEGAAGVAKGRVSVGVPVGGLYVGDTVIMSMLTDEVDGRDFVKAVSDVTYSYSARVKREVDAGKYTSVAALGGLRALEKEIDVSIVNGDDVPKYRNASIYGGSIPFVVSAEAGEENPLARAEWVKLFGVLLGKEKQASDLLESIRFRYSTVRDRAFSVQRRPSAVVNMPTEAMDGFPESWPQPGGKQYTAALLRDANVDYRFGNDGSAVGNMLSVDEVVGNFSSARYWVNMGRFPAVKGDTIDKLVGDKALKAGFRDAWKKLAAVKCGNVWSQTKEITRDGNGNNYFEEGVLRPDLVLEDLLAIFHPDVSAKKPEDAKFYYSLGAPTKAAGLNACPYNTLPLDAPKGKKFHVTTLDIKGKDRFEVEDALAAGKLRPAIAKAANVSDDEVEMFFDRPIKSEDHDTFAKVRAVVDDSADVDPSKIAAAVEGSLDGTTVKVVDSKDSGTSRAGGGDGLGGGAIAGIVLGSLALLAASVAASCCCAWKRARHNAYSEVKDKFWAEHGVRLNEDSVDGVAPANEARGDNQDSTTDIL